MDRVWWNELSNGERTHHEDRLDLLNSVASLRHELSQGEVARLFLELAPEDRALAAAVLARNPLPVPLGDYGSVVLEKSLIESAELVDDLLMGDAVQLVQNRMLMENFLYPGFEADLLEEVDEMLAPILPALRYLRHAVET